MTNEKVSLKRVAACSALGAVIMVGGALSGCAQELRCERPDVTSSTVTDNNGSADSTDTISWIELFPGARMHAAGTPDAIVEIDGFVCIEGGWLEQIICAAMTREHESLVVTEVTPSIIHATLLAAGFEPGAPGRWWTEDDPSAEFGSTIRFDPPTGERVAIQFVWTDAAGRERAAHPGDWIMSELDDESFPAIPWVFAGSQIVDEADGGAPYLADRGGSIAGLVTFGDEVLGWESVVPDREMVNEPAWLARSSVLPELGTPVRVRISRWTQG